MVVVMIPYLLTADELDLADTPLRCWVYVPATTLLLVLLASG